MTDDLHGALEKEDAQRESSFEQPRIPAGKIMKRVEPCNAHEVEADEAGDHR